jgi:starvation-inducible outer membrane lipoprotein
MTKTNALILTTLLALSAAAPLQADDATTKTVGELYEERAALEGQQVTVQGEVVKVNTGVMQRNFIHIQDGSGDALHETNNLVITSQDSAAVGDKVRVTGTVVVDHDFGFGYFYPVLVEKAIVTVTE